MSDENADAALDDIEARVAGGVQLTTITNDERSTVDSDGDHAEAER